jgi:hypothetical protein
VPKKESLDQRQAQAFGAVIVECTHHLANQLEEWEQAVRVRLEKTEAALRVDSNELSKKPGQK